MRNTRALQPKTSLSTGTSEAQGSQNEDYFSPSCSSTSPSAEGIPTGALQAASSVPAMAQRCSEQGKRPYKPRQRCATDSCVAWKQRTTSLTCFGD